MNTRLQSVLPTLGTQFEGGYFHGVLLLGGQLWGEVTAPIESEMSGIWHPKYKDIAGAADDFDGLANTRAMAEAGSELAQKILDAQLAGYNDWYLPARGGQLMQWANLAKPELMPTADAFQKSWYWNSTQYSRSYAYNQGFGNGSTYINSKDWQGGRARAVRRFLIG